MHWKDMADQEMREVHDRYAAEIQRLHEIMTVLDARAGFQWDVFVMGGFAGAAAAFILCMIHDAICS
jgi:hypothetical protein